MAYTPDQLVRIADQLGRAYQRGEAEILQTLLSVQPSAWQKAFLDQRLEQIREVLEELQQTELDWQQMHLRKLYTAGVADADRALRTARGVTPPPKTLAGLHRESIAIIAEQMSVSLEAARGMVGRQVEDLFRRGALGAIQAETVRGGTALDAARRMITTWEHQGVTSFIDAAGKRWGLGTYAQMVSRTTTREATDVALFNRLEERGHDLIEVARHSGECDKCLAALNSYGTIYSLSGESEKYPSYDQGKAAGLWHPNCVHRPTPWIEGLSEAA